MIFLSVPCQSFGNFWGFPRIRKDFQLLSALSPSQGDFLKGSNSKQCLGETWRRWLWNNWDTSSHLPCCNQECFHHHRQCWAQWGSTWWGVGDKDVLLLPSDAIFSLGVRLFKNKSQEILPLGLASAMVRRWDTETERWTERIQWVRERILNSNLQTWLGVCVVALNTALHSTCETDSSSRQRGVNLLQEKTLVLHSLYLCNRVEGLKAHFQGSPVHPLQTALYVSLICWTM